MAQRVVAMRQWLCFAAVPPQWRPESGRSPRGVGPVGSLGTSRESATAPSADAQALLGLAYRSMCGVCDRTSSTTSGATHIS